MTALSDLISRRDKSPTCRQARSLRMSITRMSRAREQHPTLTLAEAMDALWWHGGL